MPSFLNRLGTSFLPQQQQRRPLINPNSFGYNQELPTGQTNGQTQQDAEDDWVAQYGKIAGNRPNRLAYQQAVMEGAPEIKRGKWAKLGAMLAAGGAGLGGTPASQAAQLGISAYETPQRKADEDYKQKMVGLGNLAQFEDSDIQEKIKQLELERGEHWKSEENKRQNREQARLERGDTRQEAMTSLQMDEIRQKMENDNLEEYIVPETGMKFKKNMKTGSIMQIGKVARTPQEAADAAGLTRKAEEAAMQPGRDKENQANYRQATDVANIGYDKTIDAANIKATEAATRTANKLKEAAAKMKPGDVYGNTQLDLAEAIGAGILPPQAALYLKQNEAGIPISDGPMFGGDDKLEQRVREFIGQSITKHRAGPAKNTPAPNPANKAPVDPGNIRGGGGPF